MAGRLRLSTTCTTAGGAGGLSGAPDQSGSEPPGTISEDGTEQSSAPERDQMPSVSAHASESLFGAQVGWLIPGAGISHSGVGAAGGGPAVGLPVTRYQMIDVSSPYPRSTATWRPSGAR